MSQLDNRQLYFLRNEADAIVFRVMCQALEERGFGSFPATRLSRLAEPDVEPDGTMKADKVDPVLRAAFITLDLSATLIDELAEAAVSEIETEYAKALASVKEG